jgi:DNA-binding transcriptional MerR regulator
MAMTVATDLTVAEAANETGVSAHTLRYYERAGLLPPVERNGSGHRRFTAEDVEWVVMITRLRSTGMPILEAHREQVLERLAEIERNLELVDYKIGLYRGRLDHE